MYLVLFLIINWLVVALQCLPIHSFWQPRMKAPYHCVNRVKYYIAQGSLNLFSDVVVFLMPIPLVWRLQLPRHRKVGLVLVFLLGGL